MYHLKLIKGKTYWGIVKASEKKPDVYVSEKEKANALVDSGFFALEGEESSAKEQSNVGGGKTEEGESSFIPDEYEEEYDSADEQPGSIMMELQQKTKAELSEYAEQNGIDLTGCKTKDDIITKVIEALAKAAAARQAIRDSE